MVRLSTPNGTIEFEDREFTRSLLQHEQAQRLAAEAEQARLSQAYSVAALAARLSISERSARELIRNGLIGYCCAGQKNYRVSERAVRRFEDGHQPTT